MKSDVMRLPSLLAALAHVPFVAFGQPEPAPGPTPVPVAPRIQPKQVTPTPVTVAPGESGTTGSAKPTDADEATIQELVRKSPVYDTLANPVKIKIEVEKV